MPKYYLSGKFDKVIHQIFFEKVSDSPNFNISFSSKIVTIAKNKTTFLILLSIFSN
jgi:hypothetical protein